MDRTEKGTFAQKFVGESKILRSIRLTDTAWRKLQEIASKFCLTRTDFIELFVRKYRSDEEIILDALERFIESERNRPRKGNQHGNEFKTTGRDWTKLNEFEDWVKVNTTQIQEGD